MPYFPKFESAILVAKFPTYGAYAEVAPPDRSTTALAYQAGIAQGGHTPTYAASPGYQAGNMVEGKIDRILNVVQETSSEVAALRVRIEVLERTNGIPTPSKSPIPNKGIPGKPAPANVPPPPSTETALDAPSILHTRCASCHDEKNVVREKAKVTLFVTGPNGAEMATRDKSNQIVSLSLGTVKKVRQQLVEKTMPPPQNIAGQPVPPMSPQEVQKSLEFLNTIITQADNAQKPGPAVKPE